MEMERGRKDEEEKLWALQQEHVRRQQVLGDRQHKRDQRTMMEATKQTHFEQAAEGKNRWKDPYGDRS